MKAKIISIAAQKGGTSKTTTAINLASCIAMRATPVLLIDIDPQNSSLDWLNLMEQNQFKLFEYTKATPADLDSILAEATSQYKYIVIDCAPRLEKTIAKVINVSDLILSPMAVGALEEWSLLDFADGVKARQQVTGGRPIFRAFISKMPVNWKILKAEMINTLAECEIKQLQTIYLREAVCRAVQLGKATVQMNDEKATHEIETLTTQALELLSEV